MIRRGTLCGVIVLALMGGMPYAWAEAKAQKIHSQLQQVKAELDKHTAKAAALSQQTQEASAGLATLRQKLIQATAELQTKANEEDQRQAELDALTQDAAAKAATLAADRERLDVLTGALIHAAQRPPASLFLQTPLTQDHVHTTLLLRAVLPRVQEEITKTAEDLESLKETRAAAEKAAQDLDIARNDLEKQEAALNQMIHARQGTLDKTEAEKENETKKLIALTGEANNLKQLLEHIHPNAPKKSDPNRRVEGTLRAPVAGRLVKHFGEQDSAGVTSEGLTYTAQAGSPVVAPRGGHVVFAGPFRGYGKVLILQHANGDHSFLAGFGQLDATIGQDVESGEPLGTLPTMAGHRPELYFEWRRNNEPLDPTDALVLVKDGKG